MVYKYINIKDSIMVSHSVIQTNSNNNMVLKIYNFQYIFIFLFIYQLTYGLLKTIKILTYCDYIHWWKYRQNGGGGDSAVQTFLELIFVFQKSFVEKPFFL